MASEKREIKIVKNDEPFTRQAPRQTEAEKKATYPHIEGHPLFNYPFHQDQVDNVPDEVLAEVMAERSGFFPPNDYPLDMWPRLLRPFRNQTNQTLYEHAQQLANHEARISSLEQQVSSLKTRVTQLETLLNQLAD